MFSRRHSTTPRPRRVSPAVFTAVIRRLVVIAALVCAAAACSGTTPTSPTPAADAPPFPPVSGSARVYAYERSENPSTGYDSTSAQNSRFVLYDDRSFVLQYGHSPNEYSGTYEEAGRSITFHWHGRNSAGEWGASGTLDGDRLTVRYNLIMGLINFDDATYRRVQ